MALDIDGKIYRVTKSQHVKPGKGGAYVQVRKYRVFFFRIIVVVGLTSFCCWQCDLKEIKTGSKVSRRFRAAESVQKAPLVPDQHFQFLYDDGSNLAVMHNTTFEQVYV
jgi:elongation factor P